MPELKTLTNYLAILCATCWIISLFFIERLPGPEHILPALRHDPVQSEKPSRDAFNFTYNGKQVSVTPQADYQIWGLVVSHNDPFAWYHFDITHDKYSIDTRDVCVIWGSNVTQAKYLEAQFFNNDYTCNWRGDIVQHGISNNHLITQNPDVRKIISQLHIGDQILIKGMLVNYTQEQWNGWMRKSSLNRDDTGDGACEIIYVDDIEILNSYNHLWALIQSYAEWGLLAIVILRIVMFLFFPARYENVS